jgi:rifampicin phosphotransferase
VSADRKEPHTGTVFTVPLEQLDCDDVDWAGGKGANLGELMKAGYPVPKGFVVTTDAYDFAVAMADPNLAAAMEEGPADGAAIREAFLAADVPVEVRQDIVEVYRELRGAVAVRSSATAEVGHDGVAVGPHDADGGEVPPPARQRMRDQTERRAQKRP